MGLRFRKSITILPGGKLNLGKTGVSLSVGTKGLHANIHSSGKVTGTASLPGTGISYQKSKNIKTLWKDRKKKKEQKAAEDAAEEAAAVEAATAAAATTAVAAAAVAASVPEEALPEAVPAAETGPAETPAFQPAQLTDDALRSIHKAFDDTVDWLEVSQSETPPDESYNPDMWAYYHEKAPAILAGDLDAYLQVIDEVRPLDDLLDYGGQFEFGTDRASLMEVEYTVNETTLETQRREKNVIQFYDLLQDFVCSATIRIARDMFALLPVGEVVVHAVLNGETVLSARFDRETMNKIKFGYVDPSDVMARFAHNMAFEPGRGFAAVERLDSSNA